MKIVFSTKNVSRASFLDTCRYAYDYGFEGFEIYDALGERSSHHDSILRRDRIADAKRKLVNRNLAVSALVYPYSIEKDEATKEEILKAWREFEGKPQALGLPSAPEQFLTYFEEENRPQTALDRDIYGGMGVTLGRLREDTVYDYKFVGLSHNTLRGAAGGAVLIAELLFREGYIVKK